MRTMTESMLRQMSNALGRELSDQDFEAAASLACLSDVELENARILVDRSARPLAIAYLKEIVESASMRDAIAFMDDVLEGGLDPRTWEARRSAT